MPGMATPSIVRFIEPPAGAIGAAAAAGKGAGAGAGGSAGAGAALPGTVGATGTRSGPRLAGMPIIVFCICIGAGFAAAAGAAGAVERWERWEKGRAAEAPEPRGEGTPTIVFSPICFTTWVGAPCGAAAGEGAPGNGGIAGRTAWSTVWAPTFTGDDEGAWGTCTCTSGWVAPHRPQNFTPSASGYPHESQGFSTVTIPLRSPFGLAS